MGSCIFIKAGVIIYHIEHVAAAHRAHSFLKENKIGLAYVFYMRYVAKNYGLDYPFSTE